MLLLLPIYTYVTASKELPQEISNLSNTEGGSIRMSRRRCFERESELETHAENPPPDEKMMTSPQLIYG